MDEPELEPLLNAVRSRNLAEVRRLATRDLINGVTTEEGPQSERTPLVEALHAGAFEVAELLVELGADLGARNVDGEDPLQAALWFEAPLPAMDWLLQKGVSPHGTVLDAVDGQPGESTLHFALQIGEPEVVARLLQAGADPHAPNPHGATPLHLAVVEREGSAQMVRLLLEKGVSATAVDAEGKTPLHAAVEHFVAYAADAEALSADDEVRAVVMALLAKGASIEARMKDGRRPWDLARSQPLPADVLERLRPVDATTPVTAFVLPAVLAFVFGYMANVALVLIAVQGGGLVFPTLVPVKGLEGQPEVALLGLGVMVVLLPLAVALDGKSRTPRRHFRVASGAVWVAAAAACLLVPAPWPGRVLLASCVLVQVLLGSYALGRVMQPDRLASSEPGGPTVQVS